MLPREGLAEAHRERFERFAREARSTSPLYERLSLRLATDATAQELMDAAPPAQRRPNLLFAAVHDLLLAGEDHPLARWYPTVEAVRAADGNGPHRPSSEACADHPDAAATAFTDLLERRRETIHETMRTRHTQTNEVGRCAALWPGLLRATTQVRQNRPLALLELGASAGLLLHLDRYQYPSLAPSHPTEHDTPHPVCRIATPRPVCRIEAEVVGDHPDPGAPPPIAVRAGIDLHPLDVGDPADERWLAACIWPEHVDRIVRLRAAVDVARHHGDVEVVRGDLVERLPEMLHTLPGDAVPCLLHSATLAYLDADERAAVADAVEAEGRRRDLVWLSFEGPFLEPFATLLERAPALPHGAGRADASEELFLLGASVWADGVRTDRLLARAHPHGRWVHHLDVGP